MRPSSVASQYVVGCGATSRASTSGCPASAPSCSGASPCSAASSCSGTSLRPVRAPARSRMEHSDWGVYTERFSAWACSTSSATSSPVRSSQQNSMICSSTGLRPGLRVSSSSMASWALAKRSLSKTLLGLRSLGISAITGRSTMPSSSAASAGSKSSASGSKAPSSPSNKNSSNAVSDIASPIPSHVGPLAGPARTCGLRYLLQRWGL